MTLNDVTMLFKFIGGLGMFLYGMHIMAGGLQKAAGGKLKKLMTFLTKNRLVAVLVGTGITAIIQSSSATTVMVVGFVNAGILELTQAVGVIMGANIGTTVTAWLVSLSEFGSILKPEFYAPLLVGIGAFVMLFSKNERKKKISEIFIGIGILFIGLSFMSGAIKTYQDSAVFRDAFAILGKNPILAIGAGLIVTAIIQSSSASVGILQTLALNGVVNWRLAIFITLGQNIGTCVTALLSGAGAGKNAKRASVIHLLFNIIGAIIFGVVMYILFMFNSKWAFSKINSFEISIFHTIFNITCTIIMFPFANGLVKLSKLFIRDEREEEAKIDTFADQVRRNLDSRLLNNPAFAMEAVKKEIDYMGQFVIENMKQSLEAVETGSRKKIHAVVEAEKNIDFLDKELTKFLVDVDNLSLTEHQHLLVKNMFYCISDLERIGDHCENISELAETMVKEDIVFSKKGTADLNEIQTATVETVQTALDARRTGNKKTAYRVEELEQRVDKLEDELREKHINRLSKGKCTAENGVVFLDIINNLERISDHANNIAGYVIVE